MRKLIAAATVAVAVIVFGHGQTSGSQPGRSRSATTERVTTTRAPTTTSSPTTRTTARRPPISARPKAKHETGSREATVATTSTVPAVPVTQPAPKARVTTTTASPLTVAVVRERALQTCLVLAATNKARVTAANNAWYQQQLHAIARRGKRSAGLLHVLLIQESETRDLMDAQFTIDESNCYIKYA